MFIETISSSFHKIVYLSLLFVLTSITSHAQNNFLDLSFCETGTCALDLDIEDVFPIHISFDSLENIYITSKGKLNDNYLTKLNKDGTFDVNFGENGLHIDEGYISYQKDNYIFALRDVDMTTLINIYDLEYNFIQRYILDGSAHQSQLHFDGDNLIGSTVNGSIFQFNSDGTLDQDFATNGLFSIELPFIWFGQEGYIHTDKDGNHLCVRTDPDDEDRRFFMLSKTGEEIWNHQMPLNVNNPSSSFPILRFSLPIEDGLLFTIEGFSTPNRISKYTFDGFLDTDFGTNGQLQIQQTFDSDGDKLPIGYIDKDHMIIIRSNHQGEAFNTVDSVFVMNNQGILNTNFGIDGHLDMELITGQAAAIGHAPQTNEFYLASRTDFGLTGFFLTKFNLDDLVNNPSSTDTPLDTKPPILLYPNPNTSGLTQMLYRGPTVHNAEILTQNINGRIISQEKVPSLVADQAFDLKTADLSNGIYLISIHGEGFSYTEKITIIR